MKKRSVVTRQGHLARSTQWSGVRTGDAVTVEGVRGRQRWVFVAHVVNTVTSEEWVEVRGGREGEMKSRSFRPDVIYPANAKRGAKFTAPSLATAPQLPLG